MEVASIGHRWPFHLQISTKDKRFLLFSTPFTLFFCGSLRLFSISRMLSEISINWNSISDSPTSNWLLVSDCLCLADYT